LNIRCEKKGNYYQISTEYKGRMFAEVFGTADRAVEKFEILFNGSRRALRARKRFLQKVWEKQGIVKNISDY